MSDGDKSLGKTNKGDRMTVVDRKGAILCRMLDMSSLISWHGSSGSQEVRQGAI